MRERIELRVNVDHADLLFRPDEGELLGQRRHAHLKRIVVDLSDPRLARIPEIEKELNAHRPVLFVGGWRIIREYTEQEVGEARLFKLWCAAVFEPAGEECGTVYDESGVCPVCKAGRRQVSDLVVDVRRVPRGKEYVSTYVVGEHMVSQRIAEALAESGMTGFALRPVRDVRLAKDPPIPWDEVPSGRALLKRAAPAGMARDHWRFIVWVNRAEQAQLLAAAQDEFYGSARAARHRKVRAWYQPVATSKPVPISPKSVFGERPFEDPNPYACPMGDTLGHYLLSELYVDCSAAAGSDFACTAHYWGFEAGYHRPDPFFLVSQRWRRLFSDLGVKGHELEVVRCDERG